MKTYLAEAVLVSTLLFTSFAVVAEQASPESIKALMRSTGSGDLGVQMINQMLPSLKQMAPDAPESFWVDVMSEVNADELEDMVIPVYQKYLTEKDIQDITNFYKTDAGKKLISVQPVIMQESMVAGQQWGQNLARKILLKYKEQNSVN